MDMHIYFCVCTIEYYQTIEIGIGNYPAVGRENGRSV